MTSQTSPRGDPEPLEMQLRTGFLVGSWVTIPDPAVVEAMAAPGLDFLVLDTEHGTIDVASQHDLIGAAISVGVACIVRVAVNDPVRIMQALDAGASGVIVPQIASAGDVHAAISAARYPPAGRRGWGPRRPIGYGRRRDQYLASADGQSAVIAQIERTEALEDLSAIVRTPGLSGLLIGPNDLSGSLGVLGELDHPTLLSAIDMVIAECSSVGLPVGIAVGGDPAAVVKWRTAGCTFVIAGADYFFLANGTDDIVAQARS